MNGDYPEKAVQREETAHILMCIRGDGDESQEQAGRATAQIASFSAASNKESGTNSLSEAKPAKRSPESRMHAGGKKSTYEANSSVARGICMATEEENSKLQSSDDLNCNKQTSSSNRIHKEKKDRSNLRKGKWTVEEEEYASRIIHYFSVGLLTLPEGSATMRSFLAEKLNCDPMRVTKKYPGTFSLGTRAYRFRDPLHSAADIERAKAELAWLERRFHLRLERGHSGGVPLLLPAEAMPSSPTGASNVFTQYPHTTAAAASAWLQTDVMAADASQSLSPFTMRPTHHNTPVALNASPLLGAPARPEWQPVAPNNAESFSSLPATAVPPAQQLSTTAVAVWALAEAAASLTPALSQLAAANSHKLQLQQAFQAQLQSCTASTSAPSVAPSRRTNLTYKSPKLPANQNVVPSSKVLSQQPPRADPSYPGTSDANLPHTSKPSHQAAPSTLLPTARSNNSKRSQVEESALASLRKNFEDAVEEKMEEQGFKLRCGGFTLGHQDSSDGHTSQDESEPFASYSTSSRAGMKGYVSASEESEREQVVGPPTKRFKKRKRVADLTSSNVQEHNSRWDARHTCRLSPRRKLSSDVTSDRGVEHG